jgi:hypothetical protein
MASRWQMPFASSRGYGASVRSKTMSLSLLINRRAKIGQKPLVLFISDLDPSGLDLERAWREALIEFGALSLFDVAKECFVRIGLTMEQIAADPALAALGIDVKPSDSRSKRFIADYGTTRWEADVLPATVIEAAINAAILERLDHDPWNQRDHEIERARALL